MKIKTIKIKSISRVAPSRPGGEKPFEYIVIVNGEFNVTTSTKILSNNSLFNQACMEQFRRYFEPVGAVNWSLMVNDALEAAPA